jgi:hypothetical protein
LANRSVVLYLRTKLKKKWSYSKVSEELSELACGEYYLSWYEKKHKQLKPVGNDPETALDALQKKRLERAYVAAGGEIKRPDVKKDLETAYLAAGGEIKQGDNDQPPETGPRKLVADAVIGYLSLCDDRGGKSGYGLAVRTREAYEYRLRFLVEFKPEAFMNQVNKEFMEEFRRFLLKHKKDLSDRTSYNIMQAVSTFLIKNGNGVTFPAALRRN